MRPGRAVAILLLTLLVACDNDPPPAPSPGPGGSETIAGNERLGWNQPAASAAELATFRYAFYVDGARSEAADVMCGASAGQGAFACSARLPMMSAGSHTLELASFTLDGGSVLESARSAPLRVTVTAVTAVTSPPSASEVATTFATSDGIRLHLEAAAEAFEDPIDLAVASDGTFFVAERSGRVRTVRDGAVVPSVALALDDMFVHGADSGLLRLAIDPQFERTRFVYIFYAADTTTGPAFRLARYREAGGRLGERAVLLERVPASPVRPSGAIAFGPDQKLYVAFDDGGRSGQVSGAASLNGTIVRLNADGTTPSDQPSGSPVFSTGLSSPRGLGWSVGGRALWLLDTAATAALHAIPLDRIRRRPSVSHRLADMDASAMAVYLDTRIAGLHGDLLIGSRHGGYVLRVRLDPHDTLQVAATERLLPDRFDEIRAMAVGPDGFVYVLSGERVLRMR